MRHCWYRTTLLTFVIFLVTPVAVAKELSLNDAILLALRYNPSIQNAEIDRVVQKFNLRLQENNFEVQYALSGNATYTHSAQDGAHTASDNYSLNPGVSLNNSIGGQYSVNTTQGVNHSRGSNYYYSSGVTLNYTQPLLQGFGRTVTLANLNNSRDQEIINRLNLKNTAMSTITQTISAYTALVQAENTLKTQEISLKNSIKTRDQYAAFIKAGRKAPADLVQFQVAVANQQLALQQQQISIQQAKLALLNVLGIDPSTDISVQETPKIPDIKIPTLEQCIQTALKNNIAYQSALISVRMNERNYIVAKDAQRPSLNLTATSTWGNGGSSGSGNSSSSFAGAFNGKNVTNTVGLQLTVPIHDLTKQSQEVSAKSSLEQSRVNLAAAERQVINDATNAYNNLVSQKQQITQAEEAVRLASLNLQIANTKLQYGRISPFEASSLQTDLTSAQIALINTKQNYVNTVASFDQTLGITLDRWHILLRY